MPHVTFHRLFRKEEAVTNFTIDQAFRDQLKYLDLACCGLLLELPEGRGERNDLRVSLSALGGHLVKTTRVVHITGQDLFALCSIHDNPRIGAVCRLLERVGASFEGYRFRVVMPLIGG